MDTTCKECVFAEWDGDNQVQCELGRLDKFTERGTEVVEVVEESGSYFKILGRICNTCRHPSTLEGVPARNWADHVRQQVTARVAMAVYAEDDEPEIVEATLHSILAQNTKPDSVLLIYNNKGRSAPPGYAQWMVANSSDVPWRVESIKGVPMADNTYREATYEDSVDLAVQSKELTSTYFVVARAGYVYNPKYIQTIDHAINDELIRFVALLPDENGNGLFVQRGIHNLLGGNKPMHGCNNIIDKLRSIAEEEGTQSMIKKYEDLITITN